MRITVLYTNDEHGWIAADDRRGGAAGMLARWRENEGYVEDGPFLVLSGGDLWTGPALSTWFEGEPTVDVMNEMGYHAAVLGNHEFDFGRDGLRTRADQAEFAFLGANILDSASGAPIDEVLPYVIEDIGGVRVGIIGLASMRTPRTTMPTHVAGIEFADYAATLERVVPEVKSEGADVIIAVTHLCEEEMRPLVGTATELGIAMIGGGHCNERIAEVAQGVALVEAGWQFAAYGRVDLTIDPGSGKVLDVAVALKDNPPGTPDLDAEAIVARWQAELDDELQVTIGYTEDGIKRNSAAMANMLMDAWLAAYPADVAMSNPGGIRQDINPGEITLADIVGVLPFDNTIVDVALTGKQVLASYVHGSRRPAIAGLGQSGAKYTIGDMPLDPDAIYHVLINDFMYAGGDGYLFADYDPAGYMTGIDWRQPVIDWITSLRTTPNDPLENYLDTEPR
jgi:2',3'-cyclic-nucleotide 2'-phosphodiesterase (5'-nucleotidase family)